MGQASLEEGAQGRGAGAGACVAYGGPEVVAEGSSEGPAGSLRLPLAESALQHIAQNLVKHQMWQLKEMHITGVHALVKCSASMGRLGGSMPGPPVAEKQVIC